MKKKSTVKAAKSSTPVQKALAKIVKKLTPTPVKRPAPAAKAPAPKAPAPKTPAPKVPAVKATPSKAPAVRAASKASPTVITALLDVGFGNTLYIRGEGAGLSWEKGVALDCLGDSHWSISLPPSGKNVTFKFLLNDLSWSIGTDYVTPAGGSVTLVPSF